MKYKTNYRVIMASVEVECCSTYCIAHEDKRLRKATHVIESNRNPRIPLTYKQIINS